MSKIIGISCFYHDSAVALIDNGVIKYAAQEERFTRIKHDPSFPKQALIYCLKKNNLKLSEVDAVVFYEKPFIKFERLIETYIHFFPKGLESFVKFFPVWIKEKLFQKQTITKKLKELDEKFNIKNLKFCEHHLSHAASAFFPSPFENAAILTADGVGEWDTTTLAIGKGNLLNIEKKIIFPDSLGLLYSAFTYYTGFKVNSGEYKLMGLAPYGESKYSDLIRSNLIDIKDDGSFKLNQNYFNYATGLTMINKKFSDLFGFKNREPEDEIKQFHMDIAASIQKIIEEVILKICKFIKQKYEIDNLCLAGGVALNCVANGKIHKEKIFKNIWIQPASGDAGGALGAALAYYYNNQKNNRNINLEDNMSGSYLGTEFTQKEIEDELKKIGASYIVMEEEELIKKTSENLSKGRAFGWFQGKMEFGPRALGGRSIIADPRNETMQKNLNLKVKFRESFRPFAPAIIYEDAKDWFDIKGESPYMLVVANVNRSKTLQMSPDEKKLFGIDKLNIKRSSIPAVTHVDYSARVQTVKDKNNKIFYKLLKEFKKITSCPILVNTSFNVRGEPIVNTPEQAFNCFMGTNLDNLVIGKCYLEKEKQNKKFETKYKDNFELD